MARRGSSARAAALRRAQQAKATRDAARLRREKDIEAALADYFEATEQAAAKLTGSSPTRTWPRKSHGRPPPQRSTGYGPWSARPRKWRPCAGSVLERSAPCSPGR